MPAKSLTRRGGLGRGGTCAITMSEVQHSKKQAIRRHFTLFHVAIFVVVVIVFVVILKVIEGDLVAQFVLVITLTGEVL